MEDQAVDTEMHPENQVNGEDHGVIAAGAPADIPEDAAADTASVAGEEQPDAAETESPDPAGMSADAPLVFAARTLAGDWRDFTIEMLRELREPWHKTPESQQAYVAQRIQDRAQQAAVDTVNLIAARDFTAIPVLLENVNFKPKGIETKMSLAAVSEEIRHALVDAQGHPVMIVVADPKQFLGARGPAKIDRQALFDAPPRDPQEGQGIGPLFTSPADAGGEPGAEDEGQAPTVVTLDDLPPASGADEQPSRPPPNDDPEYIARLSLIAFTEGNAAAKAGYPIVSNRFTHPGVAACWEAGWLDEQLLGLTEDEREHKKQQKAAAQRFRDLGREAAGTEGASVDDNPLAGLPIDWPAKAWTEGFERVLNAATRLAKSDAAAEREAAAS